jgi:hypothetical protein
VTVHGPKKFGAPNVFFVFNIKISVFDR